MVADQNHSSDISSEQEVIRYTEKIVQLNAEVRNIVFSIREGIMKQLEDCHPQYNILEKRVRRLERDVRSIKIELEDLGPSNYRFSGDSIPLPSPRTAGYILADFFQKAF